MDANAYPIRQLFQEAATYVREHTSHRPSIGLILGSGLSSLADAIQDADAFPYADIPHFAATTVHGHTGRLIAGKLEGQAVLVKQVVVK